MQQSTSSARIRFGCWLHERRLAEVVLRPWAWRLLGLSWRDLHNRQERLAHGSDRESRVCRWSDSSWLTVARVFPHVGGRVLQAALRQWPLPSAQPGGRTSPATRLQLSVVVAVSGRDRRPQAEAAIQSLLLQDGDDFEILVVGPAPDLDALSVQSPRVRRVDVAPSDPFNKSAALNRGAAIAQGDYLLFHDADIVVPRDYLRSIVQRLNHGWDGAQPLRFLFCLSELATRDYLQSSGNHLPADVADIMQNFPGGSTAVRRKVFSELGGYDESFVGWGGEDLEFLDRLRTRRLFQGGWAPGIHLWHPPAPQKQSGERNHHLLTQRIETPVQTRIQQLSKCRQ